MISFLSISFLMISLVAFLVLEKEKAFVFLLSAVFEGERERGDREEEDSSDFLFMKIDLQRICRGLS